MVDAHHHRPTLKQQNKRFKSKHASKGSLKDAAKGRIPRATITNGGGPNVAAHNRLNRRNNAKQAQLKKRDTLASEKRVFNGVDGAPRIVAVIPLSRDVNGRKIITSLAGVLDLSAEDCPAQGLWKMRADRFKTSLQFISLPYRDYFAALEACKVADYVVFGLSAEVEVDQWGDTLLRTLQAQGLPHVVSIVDANGDSDPKVRSGIIKSLLSFVQYFVPSQLRVYDLLSHSDRLTALRALSEGIPGEVRWRKGRSWLLGESSEWFTEGDQSVLKVTGVVRGASLSANRLVHLPNHGDFQIAKILSATLPRPNKSGHGKPISVEPSLLAEPDQSSADSLVSTNDPDDMENEQTWPTEDEMRGQDGGSLEASIPDAVQGTTPKAVRRIPKGMSEYQASWIVDEDDGGDDIDGDEDGSGGGGAGVADQKAEEAEEEDEEEMQDMPMDDDLEMEVESRRSVAFEDLDVDEEEKQLKSWRSRQREEEEQLNFPDELDTPQDQSAMIRFQRYRGMRSFRTSPWDPFENLPRDYARIFQFEDFKRTERNVRRRAEEEIGIVEPGRRVTVFLKGVPPEAASSGPLSLFTLLQHEHKVTVLNFTVQRNTEYEGSVRSKDPLILCVGPRRLRVNPVYSQHTRGGGKGPNNVHKFERFLRHGITSVATIYGPVVFGSQPAVLLRETNDPQGPELVASGNFMDTDTTRVIAKRVILTGHPFKVHKKTATVRYMFFNPEDVRYFKPIQLHTKNGRVGHIRESLGTHGYFKAHFDGPITQMDTVCMALYKRVYPRWAELWEKSTKSGGGGGGGVPVVEEGDGDVAMEE